MGLKDNATACKCACERHDNHGDHANVQFLISPRSDRTRPVAKAAHTRACAAPSTPCTIQTLVRTSTHDVLERDPVGSTLSGNQTRDIFLDYCIFPSFYIHPQRVGAWAVTTPNFRETPPHQSITPLPTPNQQPCDWRPRGTCSLDDERARSSCLEISNEIVRRRTGKDTLERVVT